jgi:hypothetical protein
LYAEELMGVEGFSADSALLYHRNLPTAIIDAVTVVDDRGPIAPNHPLKPRSYRTQDLKYSADADAITLLGDGALADLVRERTAPTLLTPHAGELARLLGTDREAVEARRLEHVTRAARELGDDEAERRYGDLAERARNLTFFLRSLLSRR